MIPLYIKYIHILNTTHGHFWQTVSRFFSSGDGSYGDDILGIEAAEMGIVAMGNILW